MVVFRCTNCLWEGSPEDMTSDGGSLYCPTCCAEFDRSGDGYGPWEVASVENDPEGTDYGDFDEDCFN